MLRIHTNRFQGNRSIRRQLTLVEEVAGDVAVGGAEAADGVLVGRGVGGAATFWAICTSSVALAVTSEAASQPSLPSGNVTCHHLPSLARQNVELVAGLW